jgi:hypothetical protein
MRSTPWVVEIGPGAGSSEKIWASLNKGGALLASLLGMLAPRALGLFSRESQEQFDRNADLAYLDGIAAYRKSVSAPPSHGIDSWNHDSGTVIWDINKSFNENSSSMNRENGKFPPRRQ